uniref:ABC transporter ATP-binding protein n=1 Tax=Pararhizobium sp. IMCC3301 TaxID=3067904 RepID=UPI0027412628|nr:sn-glycerol-3-phosphate ABC transporter ATP-binding protein UgpC [Pararhizobium sp. IMCC3301]
MANVSLSNIGKNYGNLNVLRGVDLQFTDGEFIVLIGPSGCGKSTLLRMIAGLESITEGTVSINDKVINNLEARERDIAMVFQSYALYPHMSVAKNIGFPLKIRRQDPEQIKKDVARVAEMTGLSDLLDRKPGELSGGQRQRVAMGRAIIRSPQVFLFDEPLSNLDAKLRVQMRLQIRDLHRKVGATSVYVTHDQVEAMTLADRVVLLNGGIVQQVGTPLELYQTPVNKFVAGFIGSPEMNFIEGRIEAGNGGLVFRSDHGSIVDLPDSVTAHLKPAQQLLLGIRPEHLHPGQTGFAAGFKDAELFGSETHIFAQAGEQLLTSIVAGNYRPEAGAALMLEPDPDHLHFFEKATGNRISA